MLNTYNLFNKNFFYKGIEMKFVDFRVKENLNTKHNIRGYADMITKDGKHTSQDIFPIFLLDNELVLHVDTRDLFVPFSVFLTDNKERNVNIHSCFDNNCSSPHNEIVVFNNGLVASCFKHLKNICLEKYPTNSLCVVCGSESDVFFSNHLGENRTDLCENHFLSYTDGEIYHSVYKHTF